MQIDIIDIDTEVYYLSPHRGSFGKGKVKNRALLTDNKVEYTIRFKDHNGIFITETVRDLVFEKYERMFYYYKNKFLKELNKI